MYGGSVGLCDVGLVEVGLNDVGLWEVGLVVVGLCVGGDVYDMSAMLNEHHVAWHESVVATLEYAYRVTTSPESNSRCVAALTCQSAPADADGAAVGLIKLI